MIKLNRKPCPNPVALKTDYKHPDNKAALNASSFGKCMYCESKVDHIDYGDVEHIKPKSLFPADKFNWDNLGFACTRCNRKHKHEKYHVDFIDPFSTDPQPHFIAAGGLIFAEPSSVRGSVTHDFLDSNRLDLLEKRNSALKEFHRLITRYTGESDPTIKSAIRDQILAEISDDKEYSFVKRNLFHVFEGP